MDPRPDAGRMLIVDDDEGVLRSLRRVLKKGHYEVETASTGEDALEKVKSFAPDVVLSDFRMPGMNGVELLGRLREERPHVLRMMLTGEADRQAMLEAINRAEVFRFIAKPWDDTELLLAVKEAFKQHRLIAQNKEFRALIEEQNAQLRAMNQQLEERVAARTEALQRAKRDWEGTFDAIEQPMALVYPGNMKIRRVNRAYAQLAEYSEGGLQDAARCHQLLFGRDRPCKGCPVAEGRTQGPQEKLELPHPSGRTLLFSSYMTADGIAVCTYRDVTQEREINHRLLESEKMAAVGSLAGGVAHEINNPLGAILAFSQLLGSDEGRNAEEKDALKHIEESAIRCKRIVDSLLKFSRRSRVEDRRPVDLSSCVEDAVVLFRAQLQKFPRARLNLELAKGLPAIHGDPGQLSQVILNLLQNALQALPDGTGEVTVRTRAREHGCEVEVVDTGSGIPQANLTRIFEPHFTTKAPGEGTGLGLAISYRIVEGHQGRISVQSEVGGGSTFTVFLPCPTPGSLLPPQGQP
jgi:two-component system NtrC family sensor kinase